MERRLLDDYNIARLLRRSAICVATQLDRSLQGHGLTHAQWLTLLLLQHGEASTSVELASLLHIDQGAISRTLNRLEAKGFCRRTRSLDDRRVVKLELTADGRRALEYAPEIVSGIHATLLRDFTRDEVDVLRTLLRRILKNGRSHSPLRAPIGRPVDARQVA